MAKYEVLEKSFIDGVYYDPADPKHRGEPVVVEYAGVPGKNLKPLDEAGKKEAAKYPEAKKKDEKRFEAAAAGADPDIVS